MQNINHSNLPLKTLELLLIRYTEMHTALLKDSAEKRKFKTLIEEVNNQIDILSNDISDDHVLSNNAINTRDTPEQQKQSSIVSSLRVHDYANLGLVVKYRNGSNTL